jgi:hypothetical protein
MELGQDEEVARRGAGVSKYLRESLPRRLSPRGGRQTTAPQQLDEPTRATVHEFERSLAAARKVREPWFRCQELACVARYAPDGDVVRVAEEAVRAAMEGKDAYQRVAVCAWPLRALAERKRIAKANRLVGRILPIAEDIDHPVSRLDALLLLWQAAAGLPSGTRERLLQALISACSAANSWKAGRAMHDIALILAGEDPGRANRLVGSMRESAYKRRAQRRLDAGEKWEARRFFWKR